MTNLSRLIERELIIDWGHGTDADTTPYNDVTADVLTGQLNVVYGRDQARSTAPPRGESLNATLNNQHGKYSNSAGPIAGLVNKGAAVTSWMNHTSEVTVDSLDVTVDDETWTVDDPERIPFFNGLVTIAPQSIEAVKTVGITATGALRLFNQRKISLPLMENTRVDLILHAICDTLNFPLSKRIFDTGDTIVLYFWMRDELPLPKMVQLLSTEGSNAVIYTDLSGNLHFEGRQYRSNAYRSNTVQWYLYDTEQATAPFRKPIKHSPPTNANRNPEEVYNIVKATAFKRVVAGVTTQIWNYGSTITLGANQSISLYPDSSEPFKDALTPVAGTDFQSTPALASVNLSPNSGSRVALQLTAGVSGAVVIGPPGQESDGIYLRGKLVAKDTEVPVQSTVATIASRTRYEDSELTLSLWPELNPNTLQDTVNGICRRYQEPREQLTLTVHNTDVNAALFILRCEISDRIHVVSTHQGIDADFFIETKQVQINGTGNVIMTLGCEKVIDADAFRFGIDRFGLNVFGE